jgi:hypothetical protein
MGRVKVLVILPLFLLLWEVRQGPYLNGLSTLAMETQDSARLPTLAVGNQNTCKPK